jgi:hypothetical protein
MRSKIMIENKDFIRDHEKCKKVIVSCDTHIQLDVAKKMFRALTKMYTGKYTNITLYPYLHFLDSLITNVFNDIALTDHEKKIRLLEMKMKKIEKRQKLNEDWQTLHW